ncbi:MAG: DUF6785 family protein [Candidatus Latescibacterota bacterium]|nr:DUF6785 family protein [Candidatus Latescibacterota bacterium]
MTRPRTPSQDQECAFTFRSIFTGSVLSLCLACGAPYGNMVIRGSYMALDFSTPGAIFLLFLLAGPFNLLAGVIHRRLALRRGELLVVFAMLITASAICTMGLSEYLLTIVTGVQYFATPENEWAILIEPYIPDWIVPQSPSAVTWFYEGLPAGTPMPWRVWVAPLCYWSILLTSLYLVMISSMVILRRQWVERERLIFPIVQVPLEMVQSGQQGVRPFFRNPVMWVGFALPAIVSSLNGLHAYYNFVPAVQQLTTIPLFRHAVNLIIRLSFPMVGFSFLINLDIAFSLWFFNLVAAVIRGVMGVLGIVSAQKLGIYGAASKPILAHQGQGALFVLVLLGLWLARGHLRDVWRKAVHDDPSVDDSGEIMSYRAAALCLVGGYLTLVGWLTVSGLDLWAALLTVTMALLIFVGLTRVVAESGVAAVVSPLIAASTLVSGSGSVVLGSSGLVGLAYTHVWAADIRTFVMASCAHSLKLSEHMGRNVRPLFWVLLLAILISLVGSICTILHLAYEYGGINLNGWFFGGGARAPFDFIADKMKTPTDPSLEGWVNTLLGGGFMALLMIARHHLLWWPLHPVGYAVSMVWLMDQLWFSIFLAWLFKLVIIKYGGPRFYQLARPFFLGLIAGQFVTAALWLFIDFLAGMTDNVVFWI